MQLLGVDTINSRVLAIAAFIIAAGAIYRAVVRPIVRGCRRALDELVGIHEATLMVREVVQYVAEFVVQTENRLTRLETVAGVAVSHDGAALARHANAIRWLEDNARRRRRYDDEDDQEASTP